MILFKKDYSNNWVGKILQGVELKSYFTNSHREDSLWQWR